MRRLYDFSIFLLGIGMYFAHFFNKKAKQRIKEKDLWKTKIPLKKVDLWMHCASLGEFDQGLPILWKYKEKNPEAIILVTFFSPSGLNHYQKRNHCVDFACLMPLDTRRNVSAFLDYVDPKIVLIIKYEFWFNFIRGIKKRNIPLYSVSTLLRKNHFFFSFWGKFFQKYLLDFSHFFVQNEETKMLLTSVGIKNITVTGDTRYDHVINQRKVNFSNNSIPEFEQLKKIKGEKLSLVLGSSWLAEEELLYDVIDKLPFEFYIIAPHDISEKHLYEIEAMYGEHCIRLSEIKHHRQEKIILIDSIGLLHLVYQLADLAFIGGGFSGNLHNILEPAAYGVPVVFGPRFTKFPEASLFLQKGFAQKIESAEDLIDKASLIIRKKALLKEKIEQFMQEQAGASDAIMAHLLNMPVHFDSPSS
jgi:3-deoxy-D-manno-octulosonic-acid transferase